MTRFLNVPLDVSDVFIMTFMILLDSYMEPTRVGSDKKYEAAYVLYNSHLMHWKFVRPSWSYNGLNFLLCVHFIKHPGILKYKVFAKERNAFILVLVSLQFIYMYCVTAARILSTAMQAKTKHPTNKVNITTQTDNIL